jgi:hypothetical protein
MMRSLSNVEVVAVSLYSGGISSLYLHVKRRFVPNVSVVEMTLCHGKPAACHIACELQAACACNITFKNRASYI